MYGPEGQEEQADGVFAGLFAARAGALHRQVGEVYPHLVDRAAPALAPEGLLIAAEALPGPCAPSLPAAATFASGASAATPSDVRPAFTLLTAWGGAVVGS